jgi:hypothetical protein
MSLAHSLHQLLWDYPDYLNPTQLTFKIQTLFNANRKESVMRFPLSPAMDFERRHEHGSRDIPGRAVQTTVA